MELEDLCLCEFHPKPHVMCVCSKGKSSAGIGACEDCLSGKHQLLDYEEEDEAILDLQS